MTDNTTPSVEDRLSALEKAANSLTALVPALQKLTEVPDGSKNGHFAEPKAQNRSPHGDIADKVYFSRIVQATLATAKMGYESAWSKFAPYEKQIIEKAGAEDTGAGLAGTPVNTYGYLVPPQFITDLIEVVRAKTVVRAMGAQSLPAASNVGFIPRQSAAATAAWTAEAGSIGSSDLTFQQVQYTIKKLAAYVVLSNELIADADPAVEAIVRRDIVAAISLAEDLAALQGSGAGANPKGVKNVSGIGASPSLGVNGATLTLDNVITAQRTVVAANRVPSGIAVNPRTVTTLMSVKDNQGRYVWQPAPYTPNAMPGQPSAESPFLTNADAIPARPSGYLQGIPVYETTQIPTNNTVGASFTCSDLYVGQWNELIIMERGGLEFAASDQILFQNYQTAVRAIVRRDIIVRHAAAFDVVTGVLA